MKVLALKSLPFNCVDAICNQVPCVTERMRLHSFGGQLRSSVRREWRSVDQLSNVLPACVADRRVSPDDSVVTLRLRRHNSALVMHMAIRCDAFTGRVLAKVFTVHTIVHERVTHEWRTVADHMQSMLDYFLPECAIRSVHLSYDVPRPTGVEVYGHNAHMFYALRAHRLAHVTSVHMDAITDQCFISAMAPAELARLVQPRHAHTPTVVRDGPGFMRQYSFSPLRYVMDRFGVQVRRIRLRDVVYGCDRDKWLGDNDCKMALPRVTHFDLICHDDQCVDDFMCAFALGVSCCALTRTLVY